MSFRNRTVTSIPFEVSGTGAAVASQELVARVIDSVKSVYANGILRAFNARQHTGGGATACEIYFSHRRITGNASPQALARSYLVAKATAATMTPSDTDAFIDTPLSAEPHFVENLCIYIRVTAGAGAWTVSGTVDVEH